jgi:ABC-type glycerol-3-phosphate transport system permease component
MTTVSQTASQAASGSQTSPEVEAAHARRRSTIVRIGHVVKYVVLFFLAFTWLFPLYWMVITALKNDSQVRTVPPVMFPHPLLWSNFAGGWSTYNFNLAAFNSIFRYALPVVIFTVISSLIVAYGFAKIRWRGRGFFFGLCIATMMLPWQVTMVPLFIIFKQLGWLNTYLPLVVPSLFGHPYFIFMLRQFFLTIPEELSEAARIEGATEFTILWRIILPLAKPAIAVVVLFRFLWTWNEFLSPLIYLKDEAQYPLALMIYRLQQTATNMGNTALAYPYLMAVSTIVALPVIIIFIFAQRTFIEGMSVTGQKG